MKHLLILLFLVTSCTTVPVQPPAPAPLKPPALSWEANHPERAAWSAALFTDLDALYNSYLKANDSIQFCPPFRTLARAQQVQVWAEMFVWTSYYESSWDPAVASEDVGTSDKNTWSVGLLQMSVVDQQNYNFILGYTYQDLQKAIPNLDLGTKIMAHQIEKHGKILIPKGESGLYWSTLHPGGLYDQSASIESHTKQLLFCH